MDDSSTALILIAPYSVWAGFRSNAFGDTGVISVKHFAECASSFGEIGTLSYQVSQKIKVFICLMALVKEYFW